MSGSEETNDEVYRYETYDDLDSGRLWKARRSKDGLFRELPGKQVVTIGVARKYRDPHF